MTDSTTLWGPWVSHKGTTCPVPTGETIQILTVKNQLGDTGLATVEAGNAKIWDGANFPEFQMVVSYRRKAGLIYRGLTWAAEASPRAFFWACAPLVIVSIAVVSIGRGLQAACRDTRDDIADFWSKKP